MTMSESQSKPNLTQLIGEAREDTARQQAATEALANQRPSQPKFKMIFGWLLLALFVGVAFIQYPRIQAPYAWPDVNAAVVEADLESVVTTIEAYRLSQGKYPEVLSQVRLPDNLAQWVKAAPLSYRPGDKGYALDWTLPNWQASYNSETKKLSVEARGSH